MAWAQGQVLGADRLMGNMIHTLKDGYKTVLSLDSSGPRVTLYVPDSPLAPLSLGPASAAPAAASVS